MTDDSRNLHARLDIQDGLLSDIRDDVKEIKAQAKITNGRVTALELLAARYQGAREAMSWRAPLLVAVLAAAAGAVAGHFVGAGP